MALTVPERATLEAAMRRAEEQRAFWDANRAELTQAYPDEFVAAHDGDIIDHDPDLMSLVQRLRANGRSIQDIWIEFMATDRHKLLL